MPTAFLNYFDFTTYANYTALGAATTTSLANGSYAEVTDLGVFQLDKSSIAVVDNATVINALNGGRWLINYNVHIQENATAEIDGSQIGSFASVQLAAGTAAAPSLNFATATTTGLYLAAAGTLGFAVGGAMGATLSATAFVLNTGVQISAPAGSAAAPGWSFTGDLDTGAYHISANTFGFANNGVLSITFSASAITAALPIAHAVGLVTAPGSTFAGDLDTGHYWIGANNFGVACNGAIVADWKTTGLNLASTMVLSVATVQVVGARNTGWTTFAGTGTKNQAAINVDTFTATDANIRLLGQGVKGILDALILHGLLGA